MASEALSLQLAQLMEKTHTLDGKHFRWMSKDLKRVHDLVRNIRDMLPAERYCSPWLESVKDAFYEAEDILDKFHSEASRYHIHMALLDADGRINEMISSLFSFSRQPPILSRLMMQRKMQKKMENLKNILIKIESSRRETAPFVVEGEVINRDLEKVEIVKQLIAYAEEACVGGLPVVGNRGINKTALARLVYDDVWVVKNFQLRLWIDVSYEFDLERITRDIIETATREVSSGRTLEEVSSGRTLEEVIHGKRYLLVLNDVFCRDPSKWDELRLQLRYGEVGSTVIVTASIPTVEDERMWISTMDDGFWRTMNEEEQFFQAARRSYTHLDHHARQCIAICAVFPRNYQVERNDLIHLWMANGLLILSGGGGGGGGGGEQCSLEDKGQNILDELACRSFLKKSNKKFVPLYYLSHGYHSMLMYTMSVLNQKLARNVMQKECATLVAGSRLDMLPPRVRHMYVASNCEIFDILETLRKFPSLLTLLSPYRHRNPFQPCSKSPPKELNSTNKGRKLPKEMPLRVLDLRGSRILKVPNDLGNLEQLRYLNLSNTQIKALPESVAALLNLQTLNLSSCYYLQRLPSEMSKMISLRHLFIDNCERLLHMPSSMGKLSQLQTLSKYIVGQEAGRGLQQLKDLKLGGKIELKGLKNSATGAAKETNLLSKKNLHSVVLDWRLFKLTLSGVVEDNNDFMPVNQDQEVLEALEPHNELKSLEVCQYPGARFASWMMDSNKFQRLIEIYLRDCNKCEVLPPLAHLPTLEVIFLSKMNAIKYFCHSKEQLFPSLKVLIISDMLNLEDWVENPEADFVIPYLVELTVCNCPKLIKLPKLPSIKYLDIRGINRNELLSSYKGRIP